jgi:hypothetical protein
MSTGTFQSIGLRFKRDVQFPRFRMEAGEVWEFGHRTPGRVQREYERAIATGADRFPFAGGYCFVKDVEALS